MTVFALDPLSLPRGARATFISAVTLGPSYDNVQMLEDDEGLEVTVTGTTRSPLGSLPSPLSESFFFCSSGSFFGPFQLKEKKCPNAQEIILLQTRYVPNVFETPPL